jgi:hypothetical protein
VEKENSTDILEMYVLSPEILEIRVLTLLGFLKSFKCSPDMSLNKLGF